MQLLESKTISDTMLENKWRYRLSTLLKGSTTHKHHVLTKMSSCNVKNVNHRKRYEMANINK